MGIDLNHPEYKALKASIRENPKDFVAFVGAGLSLNYGLSSWSGLRKALLDNAKERVTDKPDDERDGYLKELERISIERNLWHSFTQIKNILPRQAYEQTIKDNLTLRIPVAKLDLYNMLWQLRIKGIVTFNMDRCAIDSYSHVHRRAVDSATHRDVAKYGQFLTGTYDFVLQPHGTLTDTRSWVFTATEKQELLSTSAYIDFMKSLFHTKHVLIIGLNTEDFAFEYVIQQALSFAGTTGSKHYALIPNPTPGLIGDLSGKSIGVVPYSPRDPNKHDELQEVLQEFLNFLPEDDVPATVLSKTTVDGDLPDIQTLMTLPIDNLRTILNSAVYKIIPPGHQPSKDNLAELEAFYKKNLRAIHQAWLVTPQSECDTLHGHKVVRSVGRGAFGHVYETNEIKTGERLALKLLLPEVREYRDYLNSFRRGVRSMKILTDRAVSGMVKFKEAYEIPACVFMEFVDGPTIYEAKEWGQLDNLPLCLDVLVQVGTIVHTAHNLPERVLHRDLKPANVILRNHYNAADPAEIIVLDFDLSWHKGASDMSVVPGARSQGYAAPEQTATGKLVLQQVNYET